MISPFVDLDGVVFDFSGGILSRFGMSYPTKRIPKAEFDAFHNELFSKIQEVGASFWENLDLLPGADRLINAVSPYGPKILTAYPNHSTPAAIAICIAGKRAAVAKRFKRIKVDDVIVCHARDKWCAIDNSKPAIKHILIDDLVQNIEEWNANGGYGILHRDVDESIDTFHRIVNIGVGR